MEIQPEKHCINRAAVLHDRPDGSCALLCLVVRADGTVPEREEIVELWTQFQSTVTVRMDPEWDRGFTQFLLSHGYREKAGRNPLTGQEHFYEGDVLFVYLDRYEN